MTWLVYSWNQVEALAKNNNLEHQAAKVKVRLQNSVVYKAITEKASVNDGLVSSDFHKV